VNAIDDLEFKVISITRERERLIAKLQEKEREIEQHKSHSKQVKKAAPVINKDKTDKLLIKIRPTNSKKTPSWRRNSA